MSALIAPQPWVWLPLDRRLLGERTPSPYWVLGEKYAAAVKRCANAQAVCFPLAEPGEIDGLLSRVDGVLLTGSPANVHPAHYAQVVQNPSLPLDEGRDALTLNLVRACVAQHVPLLGICRGFQEINVALGGSLYQQVHNVSGMMNHREDEKLDYAGQYGFAHEISIVEDSQLAIWAGGTRQMVNSLHGQGVSQLAASLRPLAYADDGLVEAFELMPASSFALAVQWHPEWQCQANPFYQNIFKAFGEACAIRAASRGKVRES